MKRLKSADGSNFLVRLPSIDSLCLGYYNIQCKQLKFNKPHSHSDNGYNYYIELKTGPSIQLLNCSYTSLISNYRQSQQCSASSCGTILNSLGIDHGRNEKAFGGILQCTPTDPIDPSPEMFKGMFLSVVGMSHNTEYV